MNRVELPAKASRHFKSQSLKNHQTSSITGRSHEIPKPPFTNRENVIALSHITSSKNNQSLLSARGTERHSRLGQMALAESSLLEQRNINDSKLIDIYTRDLILLKEKEHLYFFTNFKSKLESEILAKENELGLENELLKEIKRKIIISHATKPIDIDLKLENLSKEEAYLSKKLKMILKTNFNLKKKLKEKLEGKAGSSKTSPFKSADLKWNTARNRCQNQSMLDHNNDQCAYDGLLQGIEMKGINPENEGKSSQSKLIDHIDFQIDNLKYELVAQKFSQDSYKDVQLRRIQVLENFLANDCQCKNNLKKILKGTYEVDMCPKRCLLKLRYLIDHIVNGAKNTLIQHQRKECKIHESEVIQQEEAIAHQVRRPINLSRLSGIKMPEVVNDSTSPETFSKKTMAFKQSINGFNGDLIKINVADTESELKKNESSSGEDKLDIKGDIQNIANMLNKRPDILKLKREVPSIETSEIKTETFYEKALNNGKGAYLEDPSQKQRISSRLNSSKKVSIKLSEPHPASPAIVIPISSQPSNGKETLKNKNEKEDDKNEKPKEPEPEAKFHTYNHTDMIRNVNKKKAKTTNTQPVRELIRFKSYDLLLKMKSIEHVEPKNSQLLQEPPNESVLVNLSEENNGKAKASMYKSKTSRNGMIQGEKKNHETPRESTVDPVSNKSKFFSQNQFLSKFKTMNVKNRMPSGSDSFIENEYEQKPVEKLMVVQPQKYTMEEDHLRDSGTINHSNSFKSVMGKGPFNFNFEEDDSKTVVTNFFDMKSEQGY